MNIVYADNAASTQIIPEVLSAMDECKEHYGNPSCIHSMGQKSKELIEIARLIIAESIGAKSNEIIFTSGGTEANNLAILGFTEANRNRGSHIITTTTEHMSVINPTRYLWDSGFDITYLPVDRDGRISISQLQRSIRRNTILISIMFANNEIGTLQPIKEIGRIAKQYNICFHTDAIQAFGHCAINVNGFGIDMMSVSGHKIYAPKGVGALYVKENIDLMPLLYGGGQEYNLRSGTENVISIVGMGKAVELLDNNADKLFTLKEKLINGIKTNISNVIFNGSSEYSLPNIVNVSFEGIDGETLATTLDTRGIYVSTGSACSAGSINASHVLRAIGVPDQLARRSLRFSFGKYNTESDVDYILSVLPNLVEMLRKEAI